MSKDKDIVRLDETAATIQRYSDANPIGAMLNSVVDKGITAENVSAMKELVGLYERMEDRGAKQQFTAAMTALQAELPKVIATRIIPNKDGTVRSTFADYGSIMEAIEPYLTKHGFSVSFTIRYDGPRLIAVCRLKHSAGHEDTNEFGVRIGNGPPGSSEAQADGAARSYARRGALCDALNIVVDHDNDARMQGAKITPEQAAALKARAVGCGADEAKLLRFAGADSYEEIRCTAFAALDDLLRKKEQATQAVPTTARRLTPTTRTAPAATRRGPGGVESVAINNDDMEMLR